VKRRRNTYRDGRVHVRRTMCETCPYRPQNRGVRYDTIERAVAANNALICHTITEKRGNEAVCRGFWDHDRTPLLEIAERLGVIAWQAETDL
jgi:hypothetical protein